MATTTIDVKLRDMTTFIAQMQKFVFKVTKGEPLTNGMFCSIVLHALSEALQCSAHSVGEDCTEKEAYGAIAAAYIDNTKHKLQFHTVFPPSLMREINKLKRERNEQVKNIDKADSQQ